MSPESFGVFLERERIRPTIYHLTEKVCISRPSYYRRSRSYLHHAIVQVFCIMGSTQIPSYVLRYTVGPARTATMITQMRSPKVICGFSTPGKVASIILSRSYISTR
jgi:hypothetical protein